MWQELRNEAANACFEYVQEAGLLGPLAGWESSLRIKTWVPETLRAQTAAYALQWHRSIPLKGIIIGQSPTPYDKGSPSSNETAPHLAASFAFKDGAEPPAASEILANEFRLCGKDGEEAMEAVRDCWKLVGHGVLSVHALPLGMENRFDWSPATESDVLQMQLLAKLLCRLIALSAEMRPRGSTRVVAMGRWAHDLASELRKQLTERLHAGLCKYWTLDIRASLSHPTRTWHKYQTRTPDQITMGREEDLRALYDLFTADKEAPGDNGNGNGAAGNGYHHHGGGNGPAGLAPAADDARTRIASYMDSVSNGVRPSSAAVSNGVRSSVNGTPLSLKLPSPGGMANENVNVNVINGAAAAGNGNGYVRSAAGYNSTTANGSSNGECAPIGFARGGMRSESPARDPASAAGLGPGVLNEIQLDSNLNRLDISGNGHGIPQWPERGARCAPGGGGNHNGTPSRPERVVPVFGTGPRNMEEEQKHKLLFNREYETRVS